MQKLRFSGKFPENRNTGRRQSVTGLNTGHVRADEHHVAHDLDPEEFATRVRALAVTAHRLLTNPGTSYLEVVELSRQLDDLQRQRQKRGLPEREIDRWLRNAAKRVREHRYTPRNAQVAG
jgi:hypothetical protein